VQHHSICLCNTHQLLIYLIACKCLFSDFLFLLLSHGGPAVCDDNIGILCGCHGLICDGEPIGILRCKIHYHRVGTIALGAGNLYVHACFQTADDEGVCHVVAVTDIAHGQSFQLALVFADGQQVCHNLTGVTQVCQPIDDGNGAVFGKHFHFLLLEGTNHNPIQHTAHDASGILCGLASANLGILCTDKQRMTAQLIHPCFKGNTGTGGGFFKNHTQCFALQEMMFLAFLDILLHGCCQIKQFINFLCCAVQKLQKMFHSCSSLSEGRCPFPTPVGFFCQ